MEWDGASWTTRESYSGALAFDLIRDALLSFGPTALLTRSALPASTTDLGFPCGGTNTATSLTAFDLPRPGNGGFHLDVRAEAASRPALLGFGLGSASIPLGHNCTLHLQNPLGSVLAFTNARGFLHQPFMLPNNLSLRGVTFFAEAAVFDPASPGSLAMTQGLRITIGD